jgi:hypothetical protein
MNTGRIGNAVLMSALSACVKLAPGRCAAGAATME